ncbi:hypothetical protein D9611_007168 [Ephemerocybe angulata]|uniref:NYN domain-containing protein n=1 Tax=Ephemerocybe angulata TaxID=980116 RepID=A0A8H5B0S1_9AGAR|nr:hypothetical protein D9611_007168 [Tulosesus angulatus]
MVEKGDVAVFWELEQTRAMNIASPEGIIAAIQGYADPYGQIKNLTAYTQYDPEAQFSDSMQQRPLYNRLAELNYSEVKFCPPDCRRRPTIGLQIVVDIAFYCTLEHPETKTIVFITGDRDFTSLAQMLHKHGKQIVVLVMAGDSFAEIEDPDSYWPRPSETQDEYREKKRKRAKAKESDEPEGSKRRKAHPTKAEKDRAVVPTRSSKGGRRPRH